MQVFDLSLVLALTSWCHLSFVGLLKLRRSRLWTRVACTYMVIAFILFLTLDLPHLCWRCSLLAVTTSVLK